MISLHLPLLLLILNSILEQCDGISLIYSSSIEVCKRYRISMHKGFAGISALINCRLSDNKPSITTQII